MKNKKIVLIFTVLFIIVLVGGYFGIQYVKEKQAQSEMTEYTPQEEITDEQYRQTIVSLYFPSKETKEIVPEARLVDIKEIINDPYDKLVKLLIEGPKSDKTEKVLPENTKVLKTYLENDCVTIDVSGEILTYKKDSEEENKVIKENMIKSIVNTLTELTEVNHVKILVDGKENPEFSDTYTRAGMLEKDTKVE